MDILTALVIGLLIGVGLGTAFWVGALRRSFNKPEGTTSRFIKILGGGGGPKEPA